MFWNLACWCWFFRLLRSWELKMIFSSNAIMLLETAFSSTWRSLPNEDLRVLCESYFICLYCVLKFCNSFWNVFARWIVTLLLILLSSYFIFLYFTCWKPASYNGYKLNRELWAPSKSLIVTDSKLSWLLQNNWKVKMLNN